MTDLTALRQAVDHLLDGDLDPLLELLAEDVELEVAGGESAPGRRHASGVRAVADYFAPLGAFVAFWQIDYGAADGQVIAWGKEGFTLQGSGLEGDCEFALVFDLCGGRIARLLVIEDLVSFVRSGGRLPEPAAA